MAIFRIYANEQGASTIEKLDLVAHPSLKDSRRATGVYFREFPAGTFLDWHPAPRRQIVVLVSGELENVLGDGSVHRFGPGDARILEDVSGRGHTTRVIGERAAVVAVVPLE